MKRINYIKEGELLKNSQPIVLNDSFLEVTLNTNDLTFKINKKGKKRSESEGNANDLAGLKIKVRKALENLGVYFEGEFRNHLKGKV